MTLVPEVWRVSDWSEDWRTGKWKAGVAQRPSERQLKAYDEGRTIGLQSEQAEAAVAARVKVQQP